jgi:hypothetical protein
MPVNDAPRIGTIRTRGFTISRPPDNGTFGIPILRNNGATDSQHSPRPEVGNAVSINLAPELVREQTLYETHVDCKVLKDVARSPFLVAHERFLVTFIVAGGWPVVDSQDLYRY